MRSMTCLAFAVACASLTACDQSAPLSSNLVHQLPQDQDAAAAAPQAEAGSAADGGAANPGELVSCAALAAGGLPDRLKDFQWMYQVGPERTGFERPYDMVTIPDGCTMKYQQHNTAGAKMVTMNAQDCAAVRGWATNRRFLEVLTTGENCPFGDGNPGDVFDLDLNDDGRVARKTYLCPEPTVESVRACLRPLIARLFPN